MDELFSAEFFIGNRERLCQLFTGTAPIVLTANGLIQRGPDEAFTFYQDRNFWYLTGCDTPDTVLVMDKGREYLIVPSREDVRETFDGAVDFDELSRRSGIKNIYNGKDGWKHLASRLKKVKHVATLAPPPRYIDFWGMYTNPARAELIRKMREINSKVELLDLHQHLSRMRVVKQEPELRALQRAVDITAATLKEVIRPMHLAKYAYEYEMEADITRGFRRRGAAGHAFDPIVVGGVRACTMHHMANDGQLANDELIVIDVGANFGHYAADIARTVTLNGHRTHRQQAVYDAVAEAQDHAFSLLKPGVVLQDYEDQMEAFVGEKLRELGLIKTIDTANVRKFFPHRTSHFVGLDAHDAGDYNHPIEPGVVVAVEPGIYIPEEGIGVRIEDDAIITDTGAKNISGRLPR